MGVRAWFNLVRNASPNVLWDFQNDTGLNVSDRSGNGFTGAYTNTNAQARPGHLRLRDGALGHRLVRNQWYVTLATYSFNGSSTTTTFSVEAVLQHEPAWPAGTPVGLYQSGVGTFGDGDVMIRSGDVGLRAGQLQYRAAGANVALADTAFDFRSGQLIHIAEVTDGTNTSIYRNGVLVASAGATTVTSGGGLFAGGQSGGAPATRQITGVLYGFATYTYALPAPAVRLRARVALDYPGRVTA